MEQNYLDVAPILEFDEDTAEKHKEAFFNNGKKPFHQFDKIKRLKIHEAILFFSRSFDQLTEVYEKCEQIYEFKAASAVSPVYLYNKELIIALCPLGGPAAANLMEELRFVGITTFLAVGTCGCLKDDANLSALLLPNRAIRDEGLSYHYLPPSRTVETDAELTAKIKQVLIKEKFPFMEGTVWTTDAMYRETPNRIARRKEEGAFGVEMECASLAACAKYNKVRFAQVLYFSDKVSTNKWVWRKYDKIKLRTKLLKICINVLQNSDL